MDKKISKVALLRGERKETTFAVVQKKGEQELVKSSSVKGKTRREGRRM